MAEINLVGYGASGDRFVVPVMFHETGDNIGNIFMYDELGLHVAYHVQDVTPPKFMTETDKQAFLNTCSKALGEDEDNQAVVCMERNGELGLCTITEYGSVHYQSFNSSAIVELDGVDYTLEDADESDDEQNSIYISVASAE